MTTTAVLDQTFLGMDRTTAETTVTILDIGVQTGVGALAGLVFGIVNPIGGAIFVATSGVARIVGVNIINALPDTAKSVKIALRIAAIILSFPLGAIAAAYAGFTMTALGAIGMTFIVLPISQLICMFAIKHAIAIENANRQYP